MRLALTTFLAVTVVLGAVGCGAPTDPTPNRAPPSNGDYPPGPYGYGQGTIMANLNFVGKQSPMNVDYTTLPMQPIDMATVRQNAKLILIDGAARWCTPCNRDQPNMRQIEQDYASKGVVTMEVLVEGGYGVAATDDDINRWANQYQLSGIIAIDPGYALAKYADVTAFPVYMVVRASNMRVDYMQVDALAASPIEPVLDSLLAQ
ncbi:MAG TPA: redoxin family protein [Polyangia bacterium]|nr:redoxin family protein [Polyangia bacterium]